MFSNLSIKKRLILGFGVLIIIFLVSNIIGFTRMIAIKGNLETVVNDRLPKLMESNLVLERTLSADRFMRTLLLEESKEGRNKYMADIADIRKKNTAALTALEATLITPDAKELMARLNKDRTGLQPLYQRFYDSLDKNSNEGRDILFKEYIPISLSFLQDLGKMVELQSQYMNDANNEAEAYYQEAKLFSISILCLGILIAIGFAFWNIRSITIPLERIRRVVTDTKSNNDFTLCVDNSSRDEVGETASAFNDLLLTLRQTFTKLKESISDVAGASGNMELASQESAKASALTSESASSMAASVEELSVSINQVADNAKTASELANKAGRLSDEGGAVIESTVKEMRLIGKTIDQVAAAINSLGDQSHQISSIVQVIKEVADQTNLLALNAAIEAARAGESGRGFAVVADEVRKLAERTTKATGEISTMIEGIQVSSKSAVGTMHEAVGQVKLGRELAEETGKAIVNIRQASADVMDVMGDISSSIAEQSSASQSIARQLEQVAQAAEENTSSAAETSSSAEQLGQLAKVMQQMTDQFKI